MCGTTFAITLNLAFEFPCSRRQFRHGDPHVTMSLSLYILGTLMFTGNVFSDRILERLSKLAIEQAKIVFEDVSYCDLLLISPEARFGTEGLGE